MGSSFTQDQLKQMADEAMIKVFTEAKEEQLKKKRAKKLRRKLRKKGRRLIQDFCNG